MRCRDPWFLRCLGARLCCRGVFTRGDGGSTLCLPGDGKDEDRSVKTSVAPATRIMCCRLVFQAGGVCADRTEIETNSRPPLDEFDDNACLDPRARWTTFVANCVAEIQRPRGEVAARDYPADCASRGASPRELMEHPLWCGPNFLKKTLAT